MDASDERIAEYAATSKVGAIFKIDNGNVGSFGGFDGEFGERDDGMMSLTDVIIGDEWRGGTEQSLRHNSGKTEGGIFGILILVIGGLVGFVDDD